MTYSVFEYQRKRYTHLPPDGMLHDPANCLHLVDKHSENARRAIGAWRWLGIQEHKEELLTLLKRRYVIDFGGSAGPFGYDSLIVDPESDVPTLYDAPARANAILSSHTFEHVPDLDCLLWACHAKLDVGGQLAVFVPSYRTEHLRADRWPYHCHTFCLAGDDTDCQATALDQCFEPLFEVQTAAHTKDGCLYVSGRRR